MDQQISPDGSVLAGPFLGLKLLPVGTWGGGAARLAGTYEREIAADLEAMMARAPSLVVDLGAAEGYYAVGVACRLPTAEVVAFEIDPAAQKLIKRNAALNATRNVAVKGRITPRRLEQVLRPGALVVCDVEGYETEVLDPGSVPSLLGCSMLVELHEFAQHGLTELVLQRFRASHDITLRDAEVRTLEDASHLRHLPDDVALRAVQEGRPLDPPMQWAILTPKA